VVSNAASPQLEELLKNFVATELLGKGNLDVIARALGELDEAQAMRSYRLRHMLNEISKEEKSIQLFYALDAFSQTYEILLVGK
jgi:hypothetical protein